MNHGEVRRTGIKREYATLGPLVDSRTGEDLGTLTYESSRRPTGEFYCEVCGGWQPIVDGALGFALAKYQCPTCGAQTQKGKEL